MTWAELKAVKGYHSNNCRFMRVTRLSKPAKKNLAEDHLVAGRCLRSQAVASMVIAKFSFADHPSS